MILLDGKVFWRVLLYHQLRLILVILIGRLFLLCLNVPMDSLQQRLQKLGKDYKQYAVTNGSKVAQSGKLKNSGLDKVFDGVFISEDLGYDKPSLEYFDLVFENIGSKNKDEYILIGDSLTSDMLGSNNAGIRNIWYNPAGLANDLGIRIDYTIHQLNKVVDILDDLK